MEQKHMSAMYRAAMKGYDNGAIDAVASIVETFEEMASDSFSRTEVVTILNCVLDELKIRKKKPA